MKNFSYKSFFNYCNVCIISFRFVDVAISFRLNYPDMIFVMNFKPKYILYILIKGLNVDYM